MDVLGLEVFVSSVVVGRMLCCPPENEIVTKKKTSQCQHQKKIIKPKYQNKQGKVAETSIFVLSMSNHIATPPKGGYEGEIDCLIGLFW